MQAVIKAINELVAEVGAKDFPWQAPAPQTELIDAIKAVIGNRLGDAFRIQIKPERKEAISALKQEVLEALKEQAAAKGWTPGQIGKEFGELEYDTMRAMVLATKEYG